MNCVKKIPDMLILVIYNPRLCYFWFCQKKLRYAHFSALFTPSYAIMNCVKKILDMLILVL